MKTVDSHAYQFALRGAVDTNAPAVASASIDIEAAPAAVRDALVEQGGNRQAELLLAENPRAILDDRDVLPVEPFVLKRSFVHRLRRLLEGES